MIRNLTKEEQMYDVVVFDHRQTEHRPLDSKAELARLLFGYTTHNGQRFPARPDQVVFLARPGSALRDLTNLDGAEAVELAKTFPVEFTYLAEGQRRHGELAMTRAGMRVR